MNNELAHLHNLASVFSERLDTPQTLLLAGESYRSVYAEQSNTPSSETPLHNVLGSCSMILENTQMETPSRKSAIFNMALAPSLLLRPYHFSI